MLRVGRDSIDFLDHYDVVVVGGGALRLRGSVGSSAAGLQHPHADIESGQDRLATL